MKKMGQQFYKWENSSTKIPPALFSQFNIQTMGEQYTIKCPLDIRDYKMPKLGGLKEDLSKPQNDPTITSAILHFLT